MARTARVCAPMTSPGHNAVYRSSKRNTPTVARTARVCFLNPHPIVGTRSRPLLLHPRSPTARCSATPLARPSTWRLFSGVSRADSRLDLSNLPAARLSAIVGRPSARKAVQGSGSRWRAARAPAPLSYVLAAAHFAAAGCGRRHRGAHRARLRPYNESYLWHRLPQQDAEEATVARSARVCSRTASPSRSAVLPHQDVEEATVARTARVCAPTPSPSRSAATGHRTCIPAAQHSAVARRRCASRTLVFVFSAVACHRASRSISGGAAKRYRWATLSP